MVFEKKVFFPQFNQYILINNNILKKSKNPDLPTGFLSPNRWTGNDLSSKGGLS